MVKNLHMEMLGGRGDTDKQGCLGKEGPTAVQHPGVVEDLVAAVIGCHRHQLAFELVDGPQCTPPLHPPSQMLKLILSLAWALIGGETESGEWFGRPAGTDG